MDVQDVRDLAEDDVDAQGVYDQHFVEQFLALLEDVFEALAERLLRVVQFAHNVSARILQVTLRSVTQHTGQVLTKWRPMVAVMDGEVLSSESSFSLRSLFCVCGGHRERRLRGAGSAVSFSGRRVQVL